MARIQSHVRVSHSFPDRVHDHVRRVGNPCVVGIDPTPDLVRAILRPRDLPTAFARFGELVVAACAGRVPAIKLQIACYERLGWRGVRAFEETVARARRSGLLVIVDAKRGDVPHTAEHYAEAYLGRLGADALTVNPYLGPDALAPFVARCADQGRGLFVLVRTSNPGSTAIQGRAADPAALCSRVARLVRRLGSGLEGRSGWSPIGAVVGATHAAEIRALRRRLPRAIFLLPGYGAQGAGPRDVLPAFDRRGNGALVVSSRQVLAPALHARHPLRALEASCARFGREVAEALRNREGREESAAPAERAGAPVECAPRIQTRCGGSRSRTRRGGSARRPPPRT